MVDGEIISEKNIDTKSFNNLGNIAKSGFKAVGAAADKISGALINGGSYALNLAEDLNKMQKSVDTVFGESSNIIDNWAKNSAKSYGISELEAKKFNSEMGTMLTSMGVSRAEAANMSVSMTGLAESLMQDPQQMVGAALETIGNFVKGIVDNIPQISGAALNIILALATGLVENLPEIAKKAGQLVIEISKELMGFDWVKTGTDILQGIGDGIENGVQWVCDAIRNVASKIYTTITDFFDINSPSKLMRDDVGKNISLGIAEGVGVCESDLLSAVKSMSNKGIETAKSEAKNYKDVGKIYTDLMSEGIDNGVANLTESAQISVGSVIGNASTVENGSKDDYSKVASETMERYKEALSNGASLAKETVGQKIKEITDVAQEQYDEIVKKQQDMQSKLSNYGGFSSGDGEENTQLAKINESISALERYEMDNEDNRVGTSIVKKRR